MHPLECVQGWLTAIFGVNYMGDPMFRIVWGQTDTFQVAGLHGYTEHYCGHGQPCWVIQMWRPPEMYGTPEIYYALTTDKETGLAMMGEYPDAGRYETIVPLMSKRIDPDSKRLIIETLPLDWELIERCMPVLQQALEMSYWQRKEAIQAAKDFEEHERLMMAVEGMADAMPSFLGPVSYDGQMNRTALIDREMAKIEHEWRRLGFDKLKRRPRTGFFQKPN